MGSHIVVIVCVGPQNATQMRFAPNDDMIETLTPDRPDQPFGKAILPGRGWCGRLVPDAHGTQSARDDNAIDSIPISDHIPRSHVPRKSLGYLTCNPLRRRVACDVNPDEISAIKPYNHEAVEHSEVNCRGNEQIHSGNVRRVVSQKGAPPLAWGTAPLDHVLGDACLSQFKPELEQFAVDARRTPKQILPAHLPDQRAQFRLDRRPPSPSTRLPTPIAAKAGPMPTYQRFGSNNHDSRKDRREPAIELNEEPAIVGRETSPALQLTPQDHQLMSERSLLSLKPDLRLEW